MAYTRNEARNKLAELLEAHEYAPGKKTFSKVWSSQLKEWGNLTPVAMVWNGPLWFSNRRTADAAVHSAGLRVALLVLRSDEEKSEDYLDRGTNALLEIIQENLTLPPFWQYIEMGGESFLDFPPVETGAQYRREIIDLRAYMGAGV